MKQAERIAIFILCAGVCLATGCQQKVVLAPGAPPTGLLEGVSTGKTRVVDLTYPLSEKLVAWPTDKKWFTAKVEGTVATDGYFTRSFWTLEHFGTHLDAPVHFPPGKTTVEKIEPEKFFGPAVVMDVREEAAKNPDYQLSAQNVQDWEKKNGMIPEGAIVILRTGWPSRQYDAQKYRNTDAKGVMHFPGYSVEAAKLLLERKIHGLGCDTLSIDPGDSKDFPVHKLVLGAEVYQLENLTNVDDLPEKGAQLIVAPIKLEGGSGGAVRVFGLVAK